MVSKILSVILVAAISLTSNNFIECFKENEILGLSVEWTELYENTISQVLKDDLWTSRDMYDACHYLMVPMHYAFESGNEDYILEFSDMFKRFEEDVVCGEDIYEFSQSGELNSMHFMYLSTQFIYLSEFYGYNELYSESFYQYIETFSIDLFNTVYGPWGRKLGLGTEQRILDIINKKEYEGYQIVYQYVTDLDKFPLAILCDLKVISSLRSEEPSYEMTRAVELVYELFSDDDIIVDTDVGGFVMQPGVWATHSDAQYAGNESITEDMQPKIKEDYVSDTSHFHRMPLFLKSFMNAQDADQGKELFITLKEKLANQMINAVIKEVDGYWLCTTFMDGTNGVYRYSYNTEGVGIEGYAVSGTFLLGWWSFLDDDRITEVYKNILEDFPLPENSENPYFDYATTREQNFYFDVDTSYYNGYIEMLVILASK